MISPGSTALVLTAKKSLNQTYCQEQQQRLGFVSRRPNQRFYLLVSQTELKEYFLQGFSVFLLSD